jgi:hypothetical protein
VTEQTGRSEAEILARSGLALVLGGEAFLVRPLAIRPEREWQKAVREGIAAKFGGIDALESAADLYDYLADVTEDLIGLILAYDETGSLPDREWIETHASSHEVLDAFLDLMEFTFPFVGMAKNLLPEETRQQVMIRILQMALSSGWGPSTSEPSGTGGSHRRSSRKS